MLSKKIKNLIFAAIVLLSGILGSLFIRHLPQNIFSLLFLMFISILKFGGLVMFFVALVKFFSKEKPIEKLEGVHKIINRNKILMGALMFLMLGIVFCSSAFLLKLLCGKDDPVCSITSVGTAALFFIPMGITFLIMSFLKFYKFFKNKC